jgi:hypothetical protein
MTGRLVLTAIARRLVGYVAGAIGALLLGVSALWWYEEGQWGRYVALSPSDAFKDGDFGLQVAPLKYMLVAEVVSKAALAGWVDRFGFLQRNDYSAGACENDAPRNLPVGFSVSNRLQGNATPVPLKFVGLTCATCHSTKVGKAGLVIGPGSQTLDLIAFSDAFANAILDPDLKSETILTEYERKCGAAGALRRRVETFFIDKWLDGLRTQLRDNATRYDLPYHGAELSKPGDIPTGPSRTRPFRSVVRTTLNFPGEGNVAFSKVPLAAMQGFKTWSQYDGSIGDPTVRSLVAVFTSSATIPALNNRQIADNVRSAADYTLRLGLDPALPALAQAFPDRPSPSPEILNRGRTVYEQQCERCHGRPDVNGWKMPPSKEEPPITSLAEIGTDPGRLQFRYTDMLAPGLAITFPAADTTAQEKILSTQATEATKSNDLAAADWWKQAADHFKVASRAFPAGHRRAFPDGELAKRDGYQNSPIPFVWLRAPFLHNGSVPTLRQLIGLDERPVKFCRGDAGYDPEAIGVVAPQPGGNGCEGKAYFLFDTTQPGNSNAGHWYPAHGAVSREDLEALLAYVGTI